MRAGVKRYTGYGAYSKVGHGGMNGNQVPTINNGGPEDGSIVIAHKEYLGDVRGPTVADDMAVAEYVINPGNAGTFPFLSNIARNFQEYKLEGLAFHYKSMFAEGVDVTGDGNQGTVMMSTQYDPTENKPQSKQEMENTEFAQSSKPSQSMTHFVECARGQAPLSTLYIASSPESQKGDERFYNYGKFFIGTAGMKSNLTTIGELWVSYQVRLSKPKIQEFGNSAGRYFYWSHEGVGTYTNANPLGVIDMTEEDQQYDYAYRASTMYPVTMTGNKISFPGTRLPKSYIIEIHWIGTAVTVNAPVWEFANCRPDSRLFKTNVSTVSQYQAPGDDVSAGKFTQTMCISQDFANGGVDYLNDKPWTMSVTTNGDLPTGNQVLKFWVTEIPYLSEAEEQ